MTTRLDVRTVQDVLRTATSFSEWDDSWCGRSEAEYERRDRRRAVKVLAGQAVDLAREVVALSRELAAERARCAAVCREVAERYRYGACGCEECEGRGDGARECAEAIERGEAGR
jgi:hypothetical protein